MMTIWSLLKVSLKVMFFRLSVKLIFIYESYFQKFADYGVKLTIRHLR